MRIMRIMRFYEVLYNFFTIFHGFSFFLFVYTHGPAIAGHHYFWMTIGIDYLTLSVECMHISHIRADANPDRYEIIQIMHYSAYTRNCSNGNDTNGKCYRCNIREGYPDK
jgi:hypothetical protein